jgi:hypothetical protein
VKPHSVAPNIFSIFDAGTEIKCATEMLNIKGTCLNRVKNIAF